MPKTYIGISRDHSASMQPHARLAMQDYNETIGVIKESAKTREVDTIVSVVECGVGIPVGVRVEANNSSLAVLNPITSYSALGDGTPLWDSVGKLIEMLEKAPDAKEAGVSFLVMAITDGQENRSRWWSAWDLAKKIRELQATDRWSFAFRVPHGYRNSLQSMLNIPVGNILEWEQTKEGFERATAITRSSISSYYDATKAGKTSTDRFFSDFSNLKSTVVKQQLDDISDKVMVWLVDSQAAQQIKPFCEAHSGLPYVKGLAYYEVVKPETIQSYKEIAIRDKRSGSVYSGPSARDLLGLPQFGSVRLIPGNHGRYDLFVQSTSVNRMLAPGSRVLYRVRA